MRIASGAPPTSAPEDERVVVAEVGARERRARVAREHEDASIAGPVEECVPARVLDLVDVLPVVETRAAHRLLVRAEAERMHEVEPRADGEREPARVARVRRDLRPTSTR